MSSRSMRQTTRTPSSARRSTAAVEVIDLEDRHVPAVATALVEQAPGGRALGDRADDLEELVADRHQRVVQPELGDARILEAHGHAECGAQLGRRPVAVIGDERHLPEPDHDGNVPRRIGRRLLLASRRCRR